MSAIAFIVGSLEPGHDGLGDYTRAMAEELSCRGYDCLLVALADRGVTAALEERPGARCGGARLLRLPRQLPWPDRVARARSAMAEAGTSHVSLHMAPFTYQRRGILWRERAHFAALLEGVSRHVMFHELWTGDGVYARPRKRMLGLLQRRCVLSLMRSLRPAVAHTSNAYYAERLADYGVRAGILPLFGNIPVGRERADPWLFAALAERAIDIDAARRRDFWLVGMFGGLGRDWPVEALLRRVQAAAAGAGRRAVVVSIGHTRGVRLDAWAAAHPGIAFAELGPQSGQRVSQVLNSLDAGLTPTPYYLLGKSGSVAAMLEHGVPVLTGWGDIRPDLPAVPGDVRDLVYRPQADLAALAARRPGHGVRGSRLPVVARQFLGDLGLTETGPAAGAAARRGGRA